MTEIIMTEITIFINGKKHKILMAPYDGSYGEYKPDNYSFFIEFSNDYISVVGLEQCDKEISVLVRKIKGADNGKNN